MANGYSSESTQQELSNEYQHDRVWMVYENICVFVLWMKVASALKGLKITLKSSHQFFIVRLAAMLILEVQVKATLN